MDKETNTPVESEFKSSPLYRALKSIGEFFSGQSGPPAPTLENEKYMRFRSIDDKVMAFFHLFANISAIALVVILLIAVIDVIGAKLHKAGLLWASGISNSTAIIKFCHIPLVFLAVGFVTLDQGHTRIDLICGKFPRWLEKGVLFLSHILGIAISVFIAYGTYTQIFVSDLKFQKTVSGIPGNGMAKWPFTLFFIVGFTLLALSFLWSMIRMIIVWKDPTVNPYYVLHPEKAHGPDEGPGEPEEGGEPA